MYEGQVVVDRHGEPVGVLVESGDARFLAVRTGLLGRPHLVPSAGAVEAWPDILVPYDRQLLRDSPRLSKRVLNRSKGHDVLRHYHVPSDQLQPRPRVA